MNNDFKQPQPSYLVDDAVDAIEMAPSDTSFDQSHGAYMHHNPQPLPRIANSQTTFPPRQ